MDKTMSLCRRRDLILLCCLGGFLFIWVQIHSLSGHHDLTTSIRPPRPAWSLPKNLSPAKESQPMWRHDHGLAETKDGFVANETLGFGGLIAVSTRKSKRKPILALAAELTGLQISVPDQPIWTDADVENFRTKNHSVISRGSAMSWLGHLNAIKWFVEQGWETAMIMEDDVNWDIHLRNQQVPFLARALHEVVDREIREHGDIIHPSKRPEVLKSTIPPKNSIEFRSTGSSSHHHQPKTFWPDTKYWDLIYVGHCGDFFPATRLPDLAHSIFPDPTLSTLEGLHADTQRFMRPLPIPPKHRFVHQSVDPLCTFAYALTRASAIRLLDDLAHEAPAGTFAYDVRILETCRDGAYKCWSANPELIHHVDDTKSEITDLNNGELAIPEAIPHSDAERQLIEDERVRPIDTIRARARGTPNVACGIRTLIEKMGAGAGVRAMVSAAMGMNGVCPMPIAELDLLKGQIFERGRTKIPI